MQIQSAGSTYSASFIHADSDCCGSIPAESVSAGPQDDSISVFSEQSGPSQTGELNDLYAQKAQAESELGIIKSQADDSQAKISTRKDEIIKDKQGSAPANQADQEYEEAKAEYAEAQTAKASAQQELSRIGQESAANNQAVNSNAQQRAQAASELSAAQSELSSLTPPSAPGGDDESAQAAYQTALAEYQAKKSALESRVNALQAQKSQLEAQAQQLQAKQQQLTQAQQKTQAEVTQQDAKMQAAQAKVQECQNKIADSNPEVQQAMEEDADLQALQDEQVQMQEQQAQKEAEIAQLDAQIAAAEAKSEELQAAKTDAAERDFQDAAGAAGCDTAKLETNAQNSAAQEKYGKDYADLSRDEKVAIAAKVEGEVTLEIMDAARQMLRDNPDDEAAQAVLDKGQSYLSAQENLSYACLNNSLDGLSEDLSSGAAAAMEAAREKAQAEGADPETAALEALSQYAAQASGTDISFEEKAVLNDISSNASEYLDAIQRSDKGQALCDNLILNGAGRDNIFDGSAEEAESAGEASSLKEWAQEKGIFDKFNPIEKFKELAQQGKDALQKLREANQNPNLSDMKQQIAQEYGIDPDDVQVISTGDKNDIINVSSGENGEVVIDINGKKTTYSKEEAQKLIIDAGNGSDTITIDADVKADMHIMGGDGDDYIQGGGGNDVIYGGNGSDTVYGLSGNDKIYGGRGKDYIDGGRGDDSLYGGKGEDNIVGGKGNDKLYGGAGNDLLIGASGDDQAYGQGGSDRVIADSGDKVTSDKNDPEILHLETADVPQNITVEGSDSEKERIESDLEFLASTENGQLMFKEIAATGHTVTIQAAGKDDKSSRCSYNGITSSIGFLGSDSTITYQLTKTSLGGDVNAEAAERAPVVSLFHEMCHSYNAAKGNMNHKYYDQATGEKVAGSLTGSGGSIDDKTGGLAGVEWQAVGLDNDKIKSNPDLLTENGLRDLLGYEHRTVYSVSAWNKAAQRNGSETWAEHTAGSKAASAGETGTVQGAETAAGEEAGLSEGLGSGSLADTAGDLLDPGPGLDDLKRQIQQEYGIAPKDIQVIKGTGKGDNIQVYGNDSGEVVVSINGKETVYTQEEAQKLIIDAGAGDDIITVDAGVTANMHILGGSGDDYIQGGGGNDTIYGGHGNDTLYGLSGSDVIDGGTGKDYIDGGKGNDRLYGGRGDDILVGGKGDDELYGWQGDDLLIGASGSDYVEGQDGSDSVIADAGDNVSSDNEDPEILHLETVKVPDNFVVEGDPTEIERIESDLEFLASTENGQKMFEEIAATQHTVTIQATSGGSNCSINPAAASSESGCDSTIHYNMTKIKLSGSENWIERAPVVSLFHEMCHSYNAAKGNMNINYYDQTSGAQASNSTLSDVHSSVDSTNGSVGGFEWQAVGIDNANIEANPDLLTENGLRSLLGYNRRERYY